ncbi:glutamine--fructose-6-phosphate transaminase (isomerizing) [Evtepia sp.]|jgi:glucosamine--fructose-6-phosphate aminotransferase (isomerizing)|uniref:glutamine--fructose-6-phosphate transaminase (isomerizing) n=1 Tax=Evtepia sp. TaxID=2773933 RepID=UPI001DCBCDBD|nr:glutamine--fructose-6-phosphate transaminase (isomerizing) [Evtepia sp.]MBD9248112.1 glutamine--fructose-6-phosphate transaminase (isomerizing) [Clostridiales bacterium]MDO5595811.1 glutamine--fructose-6-phosphate transaminase (isomerizing) [Bacillota bacterium]MEE0255891.1 glutamine--fructose-6-phosphate transaminase (isomerizing) [Evtepia sp.]
MCGIVGFTGSQNAAPILLDGLKKLEYRGYDSAGIAVLGENGIHMVKASGMIKNLDAKIKGGAALPGHAGIGHTRWATHGEPTDVNAHPHMSNDNKFAVVHNGIIENYAQLREELKGKGFQFKSETDTEVIVHLMDMYYEGDLKKAVLKTISRLEGAYALGILCSEEGGRIVAARQSAPLIVGVGIGENYFASDVTALVAHTKNVIYMEDGEIADITPENITIYDTTGKVLEKTVTRIAWDIAAAEKGGYEHFMLKEIMEQPHAIKSTIEPRIKDGEIVLDDFSLSDEDLKQINKIMITACGSAFYAGSVGKYVIEELCRIPVEADLASELRYRNPLVDEHTLLVVVSQSGETADTIAAMKECKARGARVLAIVNVVGSTIAKLADDVVYTWAGPEIAVATTKGYTTQVAVMDMLAVYLARRLGRLDDAQNKELVDAILQFPSLIQRSIDLNPNLPALAEKYHSHNDVFFIGRNLDYAASMEGSLKLKEISYLHSEAYAAGELKHGTIALIEKGRPVVALACYETLFDKMMSNIKEVKARGAQVLAVVLEGNRQIFAEADDVIFVPRTKEIFNTLPEIVPLQLFAYYVAKANGCAIDKPKNLAKSVTVE